MPKKSITRKSSIIGWLRNHAARLTPGRLEWLVIAGGAIVFLITLIAGQLTRAYGSDDVAVQVILQSWSHGVSLWSVVGSDNFALKIPLYLLEDFLLPHNSRLKLFILVVCFAAMLYACMVVFMRSYVPKLERRRNLISALVVFLPLAWYFGITALPNPNATFVDISWVTNFFKLNLRNLELGVAILLLLPWAGYLEGRMRLDTWLHRLAALVLALFTGFFFYSDPYFLFTLGGAAVIVVAGLWVARKVTTAQLSVSIGYLGVALGGYKLASKVLRHLHYFSGQFGNFGFPPFPNLTQTLLNTGEGVFKMFNADFWGQLVQGAHEKTFLINASLVILCTTAVVYGARRLRAEFDVLRLLLVACIVMTLGTYAFTLAGTDSTESRYVMLAIICALPLLGEWLLALARSPHLRRMLYVVLAVGMFSLALNVLVNLRMIQGAVAAQPKDSPNWINYQIIQAAEKARAYKGYADYWDSDINTYLSNRQVVFIPTICSTGVSGSLSRYNWLYNLPDYDVKSQRTFFLTNHESSGNSNGYCGASLPLFGEPAAVIDISSSYTMYVYDQDIGPLIPYTPPSI